MQKLEIVEYPVPSIFLSDEIFLGDVHNAENPNDIFGAVLLPPQQVKENILLDGRYQYFKGGEYETLGIAFRVKTQEWLVIYKSLYDSEKYPKGTLWGRLVDDFYGFHKSGVRRFVYIGN